MKNPEDKNTHVPIDWNVKDMNGDDVDYSEAHIMVFDSMHMEVTGFMYVEEYASYVPMLAVFLNTMKMHVGTMEEKIKESVNDPVLKEEYLDDLRSAYNSERARVIAYNPNPGTFVASLPFLVYNEQTDTTRLAEDMLFCMYIP